MNVRNAIGDVFLTLSPRGPFPGLTKLLLVNLRRGKGVHNAATDARMTMELYNLWRRVGAPKMAIGIPLSLFVVNFHSFKTSEVRNAMLWGVLRPERAGRQILLEKDSGMNTYK